MSDDSSYESPEESLDELSDGSSEDSPSPLLRKSLPQNKPSSLVPEKIPEHVEFDIKPMKIIFDHMSSEITKLKAEKESYKNKYLEQQKIANSLNAQIHDNHSLVTESSLVKELRAELVGRRLSHRSDRARFDQHLDEVGREIREYRQRLTADMETKQRKTRENVLKLKEMVEHYRLRLQEANRELHHKKVAMHQKKVAHYRDMQAYRNHVRSSWQEMLRNLRLEQHGLESSGSRRRVLETFISQVDGDRKPEFDSYAGDLPFCRCRSACGSSQNPIRLE